MIPRLIQRELSQSRSEYPVICITGPRQSGKTTLARSAFPDHAYVSFEDPLIRDIFKEDPKGFLFNYDNGAVFDEAQHVPDLFSYLQIMVDENSTAGRFVITGSQHFGLTESISQSLAGRAAILELLPFTASELRTGGWLSSFVNQAIWHGGYPPVFDRGLRPEKWYANYMSTYIQRDVRHISQIQNLDTFTRFMRLCAGSCGQIVNTNRIGGECGVDNKTISRWLTVLQASYIIQLLPSYHRNFRKRVIKTPKIYFHDTGLACHLLGINHPNQLTHHPLRGAIFENWVFSELAKGQFNQGRTLGLFFWRTHGGQEVDFILEQDGKTHLIEVKSGMTIAPSAIRKFEKTVELWPGENTGCSMVYGGTDSIKVKSTSILPWDKIDQLIHPS
jgi:predicted AAA+ superfamily ATPase